MAANARIQTDALDNLLGVQPLHLCIGIQLVEIADTQGQIGVGKQLNSFCLREAHDQRVDVLLNSTLLQQTRKCVGGFHQTGIVHVSANNDTARVQIVVQSFRLP